MLRTSAAYPEHKSSDSTFLTFISHGVLHGVYRTRHRNEKLDVLPYDTTFQISNNHNCSHCRINPRSSSSRPAEEVSSEMETPMVMKVSAENCDVCFVSRGDELRPHSVQTN